MPTRDLVWLFFSIRGRIDRQMFWLGYLGLICALLLFAHVMMRLGWFTVAMLVIACAVWPMVAIVGKRLHDLNLSALWILAWVALQLVLKTAGWEQAQFFGIAVMALLGVVPGTAADNRFGRPPHFF